MADLASTAGKLAHHLKAVLFRTWKSQRLELLEPKWERNLSGFRRSAQPLKGKAGEIIPWARRAKMKKWQSDTVSDLTKTKVVAGKVAVSDIALRGGRVQFMLLQDDLGQDQTPGAMDQAEQMPVETDAVRVTDGMTSLINRQLEAADAEGQLGTGFLDGALYGITWAKYFVHDMIDTRFDEVAPGSNIFEPTEIPRAAPGIERVSPWRMYWDMEGNGPRDCEGVCEEDFISIQKARSMKRLPFFLPEAIEAVLAGKQQAEPGTNSSASDDDQAPPKRRENNELRRNLWLGEFWATISLAQAQACERELMEAYGLESIPGVPEQDAAEDGDKPEDTEVEITVTMVEDTIVRYARVPSMAERPYYCAVWEENPDGHGGLGVADNVEQETISLTKLTRSLEDCALITSRMILAGHRRKIDGDLAISDEPDEFIDLSEDTANVNDAIMQLRLTAPIGDLLRAMEMMLTLGDYASNIPRAQSGHEPGNSPTWSELRERLAKAGTYMGDVFRHYDEMVEDIIRDFVKFNMADPEADVQKGTFRVKALGFASYTDRVQKLQAIYDLLDRITSRPELAQLCKVTGLLREACKGSDVDPAIVIKSDAQLQEEATRQEELLAQQSQSAPQATNEDLQMAMAKLAALNAEIEKKQAETDKIKTDSLVKRAEAAAMAQAAAPAPVPMPQPQPEATPMSVEPIPGAV